MKASTGIRVKRSFESYVRSTAASRAAARAAGGCRLARGGARVVQRSPASARTGSSTARISIGKTHHLSHRKAKDTAERLAKDLEKRFGLAWEWEGDHVRFERPGLSGSMHVGKTRITLDVSLGLLLTALKPSIEKAIHDELDRLIGGKHTA